MARPLQRGTGGGQLSSEPEAPRDGGRRLVPALGRGAWIVLGGDALSGVGTGLTLPFLLIYLHRVRGIDLSVTGLVVATVALASFAGSPLSGFLADRVTARATLMGGLVVSASGALLLTGVRDAGHAFGAAAVIGLGTGVVVPAQDALLAGIVPEDRRSAAFAARHTTFNAGIGLGSLIAAVVIRPASPASFELLYRLDAASCLVFIPVLLALRVPRRPSGPTVSGESTRTALGYRDVLGDRTFRLVLALSVVLMASGFGQVGSGFAGYATRPGGVAPRVVALALAANTVTVVAVQLFSLRALDGRRRTSGLRLVCLGFSVAWALTVLGGRLGGGTAAAGAFIAAMVVFGIAETVIPPTLLPIVNDLAPEHLRGRYNGLSSMSWTAGFFLAPAIAGPMLGAGLGTALFIGLIAALGCVAVATRRLEAHLSPAVNTIRA